MPAAHPMAERLKVLTQTGPDTEMGRLLRTFWHPDAVSRASGRAACGLIFAYLGEGAPPEFDLPRKEAFERRTCCSGRASRFGPATGSRWWKNSLDAVPCELRASRRQGRSVRRGGFAQIPKLEYSETDAGIR